MSKRLRKFSLGTVALALSGCGSADGDGDSPGQAGAGSRRLRELIEPVALASVDPTGADPQQAVGMVVVAVTAGAQGAYGFGARRIGGEPPDGQTFFGIGSVSKVFTGLAAAELAERGTLDMSAAANTYLAADLRLPAQGGAEITLEHLVTHYAGLPFFPSNMIDRNGDGTSDNEDADPANDLPFCCPAWDYSRHDLHAELSRYQSGLATLASVPGSAFAYSNVGPGLLALAMADTLGYPGADPLLAELVWKPLGMENTGTREQPFLARAEAARAQGYFDRGDDGVLDEMDLSDMGILAGSGELITNGNDMARLLRAFIGLDQTALAGAIARARAPLRSPVSGRQIGYALEISKVGGATVYDKGGVTRGYLAHLRFSVDPPVGVMVMVNNGTRAETSVAEVAAEVHRRLIAAQPEDGGIKTQ